MAKKESFNKTVSFKVNEEQDQYIKKLKADNTTLRDVLEYYKTNNTSPRKKLLNKERYLTDKIAELEKELERAREDLKEVRINLGRTPAENQTSLDVLDVADNILNNCKIKNNGKTDKITLANYMRTNEAKNLIKTAIITNNRIDEEEFEKQLYKFLKL